MKSSKKSDVLLGEEVKTDLQSEQKPVYQLVTRIRDRKGEFQVVDESKCQAEVYYWPWANAGAGHIAIHVHPPGYNGSYFSPAFASPKNNARFEGGETPKPVNGKKSQIYEEKDIEDLLIQDNRSLKISSKDVKKDVIKIPLPIVDLAYSSPESEDSFINKIKPHGEYALLKNNCAHLTRAVLHWVGYTDVPISKDFALLPSTVAAESCAIALREIKTEKGEILNQKFDSDIDKIKALLEKDIEILKINQTQEIIRNSKKTAAKMQEKIEALVKENDPIEFYKKLFITMQVASNGLRASLHTYLHAFVPDHQREFAVMLTKIEELHGEATKIEENGFASDAKAIRDVAESLQTRAEHYFGMSADDRKKELVGFKEFGDQKIKAAEEIASRHKGVKKILTYLSKIFSKLGSLAPSLSFFKKQKQANDVSQVYEVKVKRAWG